MTYGGQIWASELSQFQFAAVEQPPRAISLREALSRKPRSLSTIMRTARENILRMHCFSPRDLVSLHYTWRERDATAMALLWYRYEK